MKADHRREWGELLGAYALGQLSADERPGLEAHLEGCPDCRTELESLTAVVRLLPLADPERLGEAPVPPPALGERVFSTIAAEQRTVRKRRLRLGLSLSGAAAAAAAAVLAIFVLSGDGGEAPSTRVSFESLPKKLKIGAKLEPRAFGTEIHVYVKGAPSGALCRVFLEARDGTRAPAGSFRYRWGEGSYPILTSALDLSRTAAIGVRVGQRTFVAPVTSSTESAAIGGYRSQEETT